MRKLGTKRRNKKEKSKGGKAEENNKNEKVTNNSASEDESDDEPIEAKRSRKKSNDNKRVSFSPKKRASVHQEKDDDSDDDSKENEEVQYEVQSILDQKNIKGTRYFLIRWKGYGEESDTWEPENTLNCSQLLKEFKQKRKEENEKLKKAKKKNKAPKEKENNEEGWDSNDEFEVDRIIEVHHRRDGTREFLVSWKGYPSAANSWEPENNLNCSELIEKFMEKVQKAKEVDRHELREVRSRPERFHSEFHGSGRRSSKRQSGKRLSYQEYDE